MQWQMKRKEFSKKNLINLIDISIKCGLKKKAEAKLKLKYEEKN